MIITHVCQDADARRDGRYQSTALCILHCRQKVGKKKGSSGCPENNKRETDHFDKQKTRSQGFYINKLTPFCARRERWSQLLQREGEKYIASVQSVQSVQ